jgi:16S rRNA (cytosine967-C5)-methyltransferase
LQRELAEAAISVLNPGGIFGYATCSPHFAETSAQVQQILKSHPELEQLDVSGHLPVGLHDATRGLNLALWTGRHETDSMFLAVFRKREAAA